MGKEVGVITGVRWEPVNGIAGFFVQFNGRNEMIQLATDKEYMWISAKLAKDIGFPVREGPAGSFACSKDYKKAFLGKKIILGER